MVYNSPSPFEVGLFDANEANVIANEIANEDYGVSRTDFSGRLVIKKAEDVQRLLSRVDFCNAVDDMEGVLRNRVYAQDFTEIDRLAFTGLRWHIDVQSNRSGHTEFDFNFGSSSHPTEFLSGRLDLTEAHRHASKTIKRDASPSRALFWAKDLAAEAIHDAVVSGDATVETMEVGILYRIQKGTIHRMQPFDEDRVYPARFCVEQYLKPPVTL